MYDSVALATILAGASFHASTPPYRSLLSERPLLEVPSPWAGQVGKPWHSRYLRLAQIAITVHLLYRHHERQMSRIASFPGAYNPNRPEILCATLSAFRKDKSLLLPFLPEDIDENELIHLQNHIVNRYLKMMPPTTPAPLPYGLTSIGLELEFSNVGDRAGNLLEKGGAALRNFSLHKRYRLLHYLWRFGAYIDAKSRLKQAVNPGGFLEYTFTTPSRSMLPTRPLTTSPMLAAQMVSEAIRFTPVRPHSLHVNVDMDERAGDITATAEDVKMLILLSGDFQMENGRLVETRLTNSEVKGIAVPRLRRNRHGLAATIEFPYLRLSRQMMHDGDYEYIIPLLIAFRNSFRTHKLDKHLPELRKWAAQPTMPQTDAEAFFARIATGLDKEYTLPASYKEKVLQSIENGYTHRRGLLNG